MGVATAIRRALLPRVVEAPPVVDLKARDISSQTPLVTGGVVGNYFGGVGFRNVQDEPSSLRATPYTIGGLESFMQGVRLYANALNASQMQVCDASGAALPAFWLVNRLRRDASPTMSGHTLCELIVADLWLYGESLAVIRPNARRTEVRAFERVLPYRWYPIYRSLGWPEIEYYEIGIPDGRNNIYHRFGSEEVLHFRLDTRDGYRGVSPVLNMAATFTLAMRMRQFGAKSFAASDPKGIISQRLSPDREPPSPDDVATFQSEINRPGGTGQYWVLNEVELQQFSNNLRDAQFAEISRMTVEQVASAMSLPANALGHTGSTAYATLRETNRALILHSVAPFLRRIAAELEFKLFPVLGYSVEFSLTEWQEAPWAERVDGFSTMLGDGVVTPNEYRLAAALPPMGEEGFDDVRDPAEMLQEGGGEFESDRPNSKDDSEPGDEDAGDAEGAS